ncbi:MAG TPA: GNAT family N-acetyltransferase [Gaiellaceae bacterium]|jgi:RimJ/RimL family protein N-acetyltransferase
MSRRADPRSLASAPPVIETERLLLRRPEERDLDGILEYVSDPEAMRFIGDGRTGGAEVARQSLERFHRRWAADGFGQFAVERREDGRFLGRVGLLVWDPRTWEPSTRAEAGDDAEVELGWTLIRAAWGNGYATEAARAARDWAYENVELRRLVSFVHPENTRSIAVAERLGARIEGEALVHGSMPVVVYVHPRS